MKGLRYPGGKKRIASWIVNQMPPHHSYLEPFFGGGAVLFEKSPSPIETVNDLDDEVVTLFRVIRTQLKDLQRLIAYTPYSRAEYEAAYQRVPETDLEKAWTFLVKNAMSHGFRMCEKTGWKKDIHGREAAYSCKYWNALPLEIAYVARRLKYVQIEQRPAVEVIKAFNNQNVLIYADPPYLLSTRNRKQYNFEMSDQDHIELLLTLLEHKGPVMLSGYDNPIYSDYLKNWTKVWIPTRAEGNIKRTEVMWMNF